jgi:hypothetical protein
VHDVVNIDNYLQVVKHRSGGQILEVEIEVIYGERDND